MLDLTAPPYADVRALFATAQRWRREMRDFSLVGLRTARAAAERWGTPAERAGLTRAVDAERARIDREVSADTAAPTLRPPSG